MLTPLALKIAAAGFAIVVALGIARAPATDAPVASTPQTSTGPARPIPTASVFHGVAVQLYTNDNYWNRFSRLVPEVADLGSDTMLLVVHLFQDHAGSMNLRRHKSRTPSLDETSAMIDLAHHHGLRVILMPIVLLEHPRGSEWRGRIKPPDVDAWYRRYTDLLLDYARIAEKHDVELLMIGSELVSLENATHRWRRLISEVKQFYRGKLGYSANWDHYRPIEFWDALDYVGMTSYYKLSDKEGPTVEELVDAWQPIKRDILAFQREVRKPILFTEAGWCSQEGASIEAWNYYRHSFTSPAGLAEQDTLYKAFIQVWSGVPGIGGIIWWEWTDSLGGDNDFGYTPRRKPAEQTLRDWFSRQSNRRNAASQPAPRPSTQSATP